MPSSAYALASLLYPMLLTGTLLVGGLGIWLNREGTRRVGAVMIGCQLLMLALFSLFPDWGDARLPSMAIINGACAIPLLRRPPKPEIIQRLAAGLFLSSGLVTGYFAYFDQTPFMMAWQWFTSAAIDAALIFMLGGICGRLIGKDIAARHRSGSHMVSRTGNNG